MKRVAFQIASIGLGLLAAVGLAEVLLRVTPFGASDGSRQPDVVVWNESLVLRRPNSSFLNEPERTNVVHYNNLGFHDIDRSPTASGYRYVVIGDSFVEGLAVDIDSLFTRHMERMIGGVDVVNAGVTATGTAYQYVLWQDYLDGRIDADHILLCIFTGNDLEDNHEILRRNNHGITYPGPYLNGDGSVYMGRRLNHATRTRWADLLSSRSVFVSTVYLRLHLIRREIRKTRWKHRMASVDREAAIRRAWLESSEGTIRLLDRWKRDLAIRNIEFSIVVIPDGRYLRDGVYGFGTEHKLRFVEDLEAWATRSDVPLLTIDFTDRSPYDVYSFDGETIVHFNYLGHRLAGAQIAAWLTSESDPQ